MDALMIGLIVGGFIALVLIIWIFSTGTAWYAWKKTQTNPGQTSMYCSSNATT